MSRPSAVTSTFQHEEDDDQIVGGEQPQYDPSDGARRALLHNPTLTN